MGTVHILTRIRVDINLRIVSIKMVVKFEWSEQLSKRKNIDAEKQGTK